MKLRRLALFALQTLFLTAIAIAEAPPAASPRIEYRTATVDGLRIFYREAGPASAPTVVLLHGFPSSSHMYRNLIPQLATRYHVVAPDYPGFGYSDAPRAEQFEYTFDHLAAIVDHFLEQKGVGKYSSMFRTTARRSASVLPLPIPIAFRPSSRKTATLMTRAFHRSGLRT